MGDFGVNPEGLRLDYAASAPSARSRYTRWRLALAGVALAIAGVVWFLALEMRSVYASLSSLPAVQVVSAYNRYGMLKAFAVPLWFGGIGLGLLTIAWTTVAIVRRRRVDVPELIALCLSAAALAIASQSK